MFHKILIANRGEIACRVIKTAREMDIKTVAVYSDIDRNSLHVRQADEAVYIGEPPSSQSYLKGDVIIKAALDTGAQAIHPGYGFLSENAAFARRCQDAGLVFIGPSPEAIEVMGLKDSAKAIMDKAGVPVVPGYHGSNQETNFLAEEAAKIGYPLLIKAIAGGGGKGMRIVESADDFAVHLASCQREAQSSFGNDLVLLEKYLTKPRHIEVQVFGDSSGNVVHLFERDCSLQRRYQKVVEEAPAPGLSDEMRKAMGAAAVKAAKAISYTNAGTIEFIVEGEEFYFMEMNTRLQVEHPVTEMITGTDLVEWQLRVAAGEDLPLKQDEISIKAHAFEVRLYAEDPAKDFLPQIGRITHFSKPHFGRIDTGVEAGDSVSIHYDPMIAKLITWGRNRKEALHEMSVLLCDTHLSGVVSNQEFLSNIFAHEDFIKGEVDTGFIPRHEAALIPKNYGQPNDEDLGLIALYVALGLEGDIREVSPWNVGDNWRMGSPMLRTITLLNRDEKIEFTLQAQGKSIELKERKVKATLISYEDGAIKAKINGSKIRAHIVQHKSEITLFHDGRVIIFEQENYESVGEHGAGDGRISAPMPGKIVKLLIKEGDMVEKDQPLLIMESMKVEITIKAYCAGIVKEINAEPDEQVQDGSTLFTIVPEGGKEEE